MKLGAVAVAGIAIALVAGGLFFGLGGASGGGPTDSVLLATLPPSTVAPPAPAVVATEPGAVPSATFPEGTETLPVPNVIGVSRATAEARLADFVVAVSVVDATRASELGTVSDQIPAPAERLPAGATVSITLSVQPVPATIPADPIPVGEFTDVDLDALQESDCGNGTLIDDRFVYEPVDCETFHDIQLIKRFEVENAPDVFDELELDVLVRRQCQQPFEDFVGVEPRDSSLVVLTIRPDAVEYESEGDRTAMCVATSSNEARVQGSAEGSLW